jgi:hypothetical protein
MRHHIWMHVGLVVAILGIVGLQALGVAVPIGIVYLVVLACPLMMVFMMIGMSHDHGGSEDGNAPDGGEHRHATRLTR